MFLPKHQFGREMISSWTHFFSSNVEYLKNTQDVIKSMKSFIECDETEHTEITETDCTEIMHVWKIVKQTDNFLEHYCFMDIECFLSFNRSSSFLQLISMANLLSPFLSLLIPIFLLILPFFILKIQNIPITFECYCDILKDIAKNHFIGKMISTFLGSSNTKELNIRPEKIFYAVLMFAFYLFQIYQNTTLCWRFYNNLFQIKSVLVTLKIFLKKMNLKIHRFFDMHTNKSTYSSFCNKLQYHGNVLTELYQLLKSNVHPIEYSFSKLFEIGPLLKCFYEVHSNIEFDRSLRYVIGFEGYLDNLRGVYENVFIHNNVHFASFETNPDFKEKKQELQMIHQCYPPLAKLKSNVANTCELNKNLILTGPNASGKTTLLKSMTLNLLFTQIVGCGFYESCHLPHPYTHIHSYINIPDTSERDSLFQAEARRCKEILEIIELTGPNARHFCIFDELYSGTNPNDAIKSAHAFLIYLSQYTNVTWLLTTHYTKICKLVKRDLLHLSKTKIHTKLCQNKKMKVTFNTSGDMEFTYFMEPGISYIQGASHVLKQLNYPTDILQNFSQ